MSVANQVFEFHKAFNLGCCQEFDADADDFTLRARLLTEETEEATSARTRREFAKELADVVYVAYGTALTYGIDLDYVITLVHESNMTKLDNGKPVYREDGKVLKGPNYREPDLSGL